MKISRDLIDVCRARKKMSVGDLAEAYGVSRARMNVILNQREVSVVSAGRLAEALGVNVTEIMVMKERGVTKEMLTAVCGIERIEDDRFIAPAYARKLSRVLGVDVAEITAEIQEGGSNGATD